MLAQTILSRLLVLDKRQGAFVPTVSLLSFTGSELAPALSFSFPYERLVCMGFLPALVEDPLLSSLHQLDTIHNKFGTVYGKKSKLVRGVVPASTRDQLQTRQSLGGRRNLQDSTK